MPMYENPKNQFEREINDIYEFSQEKRGQVIISVVALKSIYDGLIEDKQIEYEEQFNIVFQNLKED